MLYFLIFLISVLVVAFLAAPLFRERRAWVSLPAPARRAMLVDERDALLRDLKDLEFDRRMGKIDDADYAEMRAKTSQQASVVLDAIEGVEKAPDGHMKLDAIEIEVLIARERLKLRGTSERWSCSCGRQMSASDKFCSNCGAARAQSA